MTDQIKLAHGGGGSLMQQLIRDEIISVLGNNTLDGLSDSAKIDVPAGSLAFTTDSFVVQPVIFPGGDIGKLAVCGTVNDLAARGAKPIALSLGLIIEEGFEIKKLHRILRSIAATAKQASVPIVTGDTKVVEFGAANEIFINTAGIGIMRDKLDFTHSRIAPGDVLIINGTIGDHGIAIMSVRKEINFSTPVKSDCAPLADMVAKVIDGCGDAVKCMKDPTRGGVAANVNEMAQKVGFILNEKAIPVLPAVRGACDILGFNVLTVANEGKMLFAVAPQAAQKALDILKKHPLGKNAAIIGVADDRAGLVRMKTAIGGERIVDMPYGQELPRIC
jgi:hydrogenase expression/formation protein HypE